MEINFRHEINGEKVITAVAQDADTGEILMLANMNSAKAIHIQTLVTPPLKYIKTIYTGMQAIRTNVIFVANVILIPPQDSRKDLHLQRHPRIL